MISLAEMETMLDEIATGFPEGIFRELNGGILLLPDTKLDPLGQNGDLYILGEYHHDRAMGRYIAIYYGSFAQVYGHLSREALQEQLTHTLKHEFTHHLESMAGERGLEIEDARYIENYLRKQAKKSAYKIVGPKRDR